MDQLYSVLLVDVRKIKQTKPYSIKQTLSSVFFPIIKSSWSLSDFNFCLACQETQKYPVIKPTYLRTDYKNRL